MMTLSRHAIKGVSLLELLLVLVIASGILYFSIQQYFIYKQDSEVRQLQANVDLLFQGLGSYFRAYCKEEPFSRFYGPQHLRVTMNELQPYLNGKIKPNVLVDNRLPVNQEYILQFNQFQTQDAAPPPLVENLPYRSVMVAPDKSVPVGYITVWQAQVAVKLRDRATAPQYQAWLGADCVSSLGGTFVTPCAANPRQGAYAVFTRQPSLPSTQANSTYWPSMPVAAQFTQMYEAPSILLLLIDPSLAQQQYYVCGS
jgi:type II secretory pathway pseudopilin PulG